MTEKDGMLSLETVRADVAEVLRVDESEVAEGINLMDLGLDSIRIMVLAQRWSEAIGELVHVAPLAERPELQAWWTHLSELGR